MVNAMNSRAVSIIRYSAGIVEWTKDELRKLDCKTRKLLTINIAFHSQADVDRLYLKRAAGGRGLLSADRSPSGAYNSTVFLQRRFHK